MQQIGASPTKFIDCRSYQIRNNITAGWKLLFDSTELTYSKEMAFERASFRKPKPILVFCTGSVLLLFAAYQFYTSAPQHNKTNAISRPTYFTTPACEIWPGWRTFAPNRVSANDSALSSLSLGIPDVMSEMLFQGCTLAKEHLGPFGRSSGESQRDHSP
jgi:hypothetical protein